MRKKKKNNLVKKLLNNLYAMFSSLVLVNYADDGYTSVVNLWMTSLPLKH